MHSDPQFVLTDKARRYLAANPRHYAPLEPQPRKTSFGPIALVEGGRRA